MKIINVMAASLDGKIGQHAHEPDRDRLNAGFTSLEDKEFVRHEIMQCDAVITGANSMHASGGAWDQQGRDGRFPHWFVLSNRGLDASLAFWGQDAIPRYVVSRHRLDLPAASRNVTNLVYGDHSASSVILKKLKEIDAQTVLLFGGGVVNRDFYAEGLVDELKITICPLILGKSSAPQFVLPELHAPVFFDLVSSKAIGNHVFLHYVIS